MPPFGIDGPILGPWLTDNLFEKKDKGLDLPHPESQVFRFFKHWILCAIPK